MHDCQETGILYNLVGEQLLKLLMLLLFLFSSLHGNPLAAPLSAFDNSVNGVAISSGEQHWLMLCLGISSAEPQSLSLVSGSATHIAEKRHPPFSKRSFHDLAIKSTRPKSRSIPL